MRTSRRVRGTFLAFGILALCTMSAGCGGATTSPGAGGFAVTGLTGGPITSATTAVTIDGFDYTQIIGNSARVIYHADGGATPFLGGTSATEEKAGLIDSASTIQVAAPAATVCGGPAISAFVEVILPSGVSAMSETPIAVFVPPTLTALNGGAGPVDVPSTILLNQAAPETFTLTGSGFGPVAGVATVTFGDPLGAGTEFNGNPSVDVLGTIVNATTITGTLPTITTPRLTSGVLADVTVTLPAGSCATAAGLAQFTAPPTLTGVTNNRSPFDQTNLLVQMPQTFLPCVPTDTDIDGQAFDAAMTHLFYDTGAGPGKPIGPGTLSAPVITPTNISGTCPLDPSLPANTPTTVRVVNPDQQFHELAGLTYSVADALPNVNSTQQPGLNSETLIVVNPTNPANAAVFVHADPANTTAFDEMTLSYTTDYGATWTITTIDDTTDGYAASALRFDPAAAYDRFGNLYVNYGIVAGGLTSVVILQSADGGASFGNLRILAQAAGFSHDRWTMATGLEPITGGEAIYAAWTSFAVAPPPIVVNGCVSTGLGNLGPPFAPSAAPVVVSDGAPPNLQWQNAYPEVGPNGELYLSFFDIPAGAGPAPGDIYFDVDPDGLWDGTLGFGVDALVATSNIGWKTFIPPQPQRGYGHNTQIQAIRTGPHAGRLLLCYTQEVPDDQTPQWSGNPTPNSNTLVVVRISDDGGTTWGPEIPVHTDTPEHQFMHWLTVDRGTGRLYVTWYDCRNDPASVLTQRMCASSPDGLTWTPELILAQGQSSAAGNLGQDYLEYCGTAVHDGCAYGCWTDFSNVTGDNPDGTARSDVYVSVYVQR